jgi:hypothetical protein
MASDGKRFLVNVEDEVSLSTMGVSDEVVKRGGKWRKVAAPNLEGDKVELAGTAGKV